MPPCLGPGTRTEKQSQHGASGLTRFRVVGLPPLSQLT